MPDLMINPAPMPVQSGTGSVNASGPGDVAGRAVDGATTDTEASGTESPFAAVLKSKMDKKTTAADAANSADAAVAEPNAAGNAAVSVDLSALLPLLGANPAAIASFAAASPAAPQSSTANWDEKLLNGVQPAAEQAPPELLAALPATPNLVRDALPRQPDIAKPDMAGSDETFAAAGTARSDSRSQAPGKIALDAAITADAGRKGVESHAAELPANDFHALLERAAAMTPGATGPANASAPSQSLMRVDTPLGQTGWHDEVGQKLTWMIGNNRQLADLVLTPPQLGRIEVSLTMHGDQATAIFTSSNPAVREALETSLHRLREVLADAGVSLGQAQVGSESPNQSARRNEIDFGRNEGVRYASPAPLPATAGTARTSAGRGMIDIFA